MTQRQIRFVLYKGMVAALDVLLVNAGYVLALTLLRGRLASASTTFSACCSFGLLISLMVLIVFHLLGLYDEWLRRSLRHVIYSVVVAIVVISVAGKVVGLWNTQFAFPDGAIVFAGGTQILLVLLFRFFAQRLYRRRLGNRRTIIVGQSLQAALAIQEKLHRHSYGLYSVEGCLALGDLKPTYEELYGAETIVLSEDLRNRGQLILYCLRESKELLIVPDISDLTVYGAEAHQVDELLVFDIQSHPLEPAEEMLKRAIDVIGATALLLATSPAMLVVALLTRMTSRGPVLFRQERIGKDRKLFQLLKFRTMVENAEMQGGPLLVTYDDPRVTPLGRILRASRLNELPQLINILRGDMSLVGPRPEQEFLVNQYEVAFPAYNLRHRVKPGATGLAQVMGGYTTAIELKLQFDLQYVNNYSLMLDLKILVRTLVLLLQCGGSA
jgi:exopolysaccharide biosynthesis polyprenyl glycosylphosphotransferase